MFCGFELYIIIYVILNYFIKIESATKILRIRCFIEHITCENCHYFLNIIYQRLQVNHECIVSRETPETWIEPNENQIASWVSK